MDHPEISIQIEKVSKKMGPTQALTDVSLSLESSLLHGLIGPEGSGKTTLLRILMGLLKPNEGQVTFQDHGKTVPFDQVRPLMAYMPQLQSLYADLSVSEHLDFF